MPHLSPAQRETEHREFGEAVQFAAECLPVGWEIGLLIEHGNAEVRLFDPEDDLIAYLPTGGHLGDEIRAAVEHARECENMPAARVRDRVGGKRSRR